jgi:glycosyltransferase involved in cell wall biosynthesis
MRIVWVGYAMESEVDLVHAVAARPDMDLEVWHVGGTVHATVAPYVGAGHAIPVSIYDPGDAASRIDVLRRLAAVEADLYLLRYPTWIGEVPEVEEEFGRLFKDRPVVAWMSEQGPTLPSALTAARPFQRIAVNNRYEMPMYRLRYPDARLYYLPFGCTDWWRPAPHVGYNAAFVADGGCHYRCVEHGGWKARSVETMVFPLLDQDLALWGHEPEDHGWAGVPGAAGKYRGTYPAADAVSVYASCRVYVGISWNWAHGGYGCKLARALAAGIPVLWHRTLGAELDGLVEGEHWLCSSSPEETRRNALRLLNDEDLARRLGAAGRKFALDEWEWGANLQRLVEEVARA